MKILSGLGCTSSELSVAIVGDRTIRILNRDYLQKDRPTNVISFSMQEGEFGSMNPELLGDVVISADTAAREAEDCRNHLSRKTGFFAACTVYFILSATIMSAPERLEARRMEAKESEIFEDMRADGLI